MKRLFTVGGNDRALPSKSNEFRVYLTFHKQDHCKYFHSTVNSEEPFFADVLILNPIHE